MTKMLMMTLLIASLTSCKTALICAEIQKADIKPQVLCDLSEKRCRCRCYDLETVSTVKDSLCSTSDNVFTSGNYPITECYGHAGPHLEAWATEINPKIERLTKIKKTYCK